MADKDYYEILGVDKKATNDELKSAYRKLAKKYHPDIAPEDKKEEYEEIMKRLNEILEILKDTQARAEYDSTYRANKGI